MCKVTGRPLWQEFGHWWDIHCTVISSGESAARIEISHGFRMASEMPRDIFKSLRSAGIPE